MKYPSVPVVMYHSVGVSNKNWIWSHLTCPWELFESHLLWMRKYKFETISLQQLYDYKKGNIQPPDKAVVLTFDDGYLDNWVFAYPLLKKYGFKGVIFVNPEFVDPRDIVRKNLEDVWFRKASLEDLDTRGFLSWEEMKIMEDEGVIDIQSHSMSHTWYFCEDEIIDFHYPGNNKYPWLFWNACPERKSYYLSENQEHFVSYGTPIYKHGRSLGVRRYFQDKGLDEYLTDFVKKQGNNFFERENWRNRLFKQVEIYKSENETLISHRGTKGNENVMPRPPCHSPTCSGNPEGKLDREIQKTKELDSRLHGNDGLEVFLDEIKGRYETDEEQEERFKYELVESKRILEERLKKKINFLCWPGGANTDKSIKISHDAGYLASTYSSYRDKEKNIFSEDPSMIYRIGPPNVQYKGKIYYLAGAPIIIRLFAFRGNILARLIQKVMRLFITFMVILKIRRVGVHIR